MGKVLLTVWIILFISVLPSSSTANSVSYIYDDAGRLIKAITETGEAAVYNYDEVGNLISITNQTVTVTQPVISGLTPDTFLTGTTTSITITGSNLLAAQKVTSDNAGIQISNVQATNTQLTATLQVSSSTAPGLTNITVTTPYGSASIGMQVFQVSLNPGTLYMQTGTTQQITISVTPLPQTNVDIALNSSSPDIVGIPPSVTVPLSGSTTVAVNAVATGTTFVNAGGGQAIVFVSSPLTGPLSISSTPVSAAFVSAPLNGGFSISSTAVSVSMPALDIALPSGSLIRSNQVSVLLGPVLSGEFTSNPISVQLVSVSNGVVVSVPVSVTISNR